VPLDLSDFPLAVAACWLVKGTTLMNDTTETDQRDAARYRWLAKQCVSQSRFDIKRGCGPWHVERSWHLTFIGGDENDKPLRDVGEYIDEEMQKVINSAAA
jgi:hypothetical protein